MESLQHLASGFAVALTPINLMWCLLGCTLGTVMSRLFYARKKLQLLLADVYRSPDWQ